MIVVVPTCEVLVVYNPICLALIFVVVNMPELALKAAVYYKVHFNPVGDVV